MQTTKKLPIGIDFGTSTSVIAIFKDGRPEPIPNPSSTAKSPILPSIVAKDTRGRLVVGEQARQYNGIREVKRMMMNPEPILLDGEKFRPEQISAVILKKLKENGETFYEEFTDVVLSVPAIFNDIGKHNTIQAAKLADLNVIHLISEPTAAALAYGIRDLEADEKVLVFDFGGGTLDISIIAMHNGVLDVIGTYGDESLGGKDFDELMIELILKKFQAQVGHPVEISPIALNHLKYQAETCKIALSEQEDFTVSIFNFIIQDGIPRDLTVEITQREFERASAHLIARAQECLEQALQITNSPVESIDRVLLVGGSTYIPAVRNMLASTFTCPLSMDVPPDLAVSLGTAIQAQLLLGDSEELILVDKIAYGLGVEILDWFPNGYQLVYDPLSPPNTTVPYSVTREYSLTHPDQDSLELRVFQTLNPHTRSLQEASFTGITGVIENIPPSQTGTPHEIIVSFHIDRNQTIHLTATITSTGQSVGVNLSPNELRVDDPKELARLQKQLEDLN